MLEIVKEKPWRRKLQIWCVYLPVKFHFGNQFGLV